MKLIRHFFSHIATLAVMGGLTAFVVYSLFIYQPSATAGCPSSAVVEQTDIAVHVVRQWFGKASSTYTCAMTPAATSSN